MTTRLYEHADFLRHEVPKGHPEHPDRLRALALALEHPNFARLERAEAPRASEDAVLMAHTEEYLQHIMRSMPEEESDIRRVAEDTYGSAGTLQAALRAVGGAIAAVDDVFAGTADNAFVASRPPGHHAGRARTAGFCLFNNAAIAAAHARAAHGAERIAIVDWDVHHGDGTQEIVWNDPDTLFASIHEAPLYPFSGRVEETGIAGNVVNVPLSAGSSGDQFREAFRDRILRALRNFSPDIVIVSAGFDAHHRDRAGHLNLTGEDFDWATGRLMEIAEDSAGNRVVSLLEGGYDLEGLAESAGLHISRLIRG
ncbi:histone deacetylase family protein [Rhizobiaceae bacterium BDR2-2]|uniref:Histone deacetylase family protein n=1 Tax=Ectorhizobium quercum TaxID=2965071 RepID=A0AAE3MWT7_9HYPH|nr:histone deacetylase family protein [Ectorhizobium quercum]MCX8996364.1 histone deacetylase family protein [Ectorhizobium quercum]MCX8998597.1 histone deacetylase family protein [Ectorhizobium quercum]